MSDDLSHQVSAWLAATDIGYLELRGPGVELRLLNRDGRVEPAPADYVPRAAAAAEPVRASSVGVFLHTHPLHDTPLAAPGKAVISGQVIALLQVGALLLPVAAPCDGTVSALRVAHGTVVGYGTPLLDIIPT